MKILAVFVLVLGMFLMYGLPMDAYAAEDSLTITTYYPSPYGVYKNLKLNPSNEPTGPAVSQGVMYFDGSDDRPKYRDQNGWRDFLSNNYVVMPVEYNGPNNPVDGQMYYDGSDNVLWVYYHNEWKVLGGLAANTNNPGQQWDDPTFTQFLSQLNDAPAGQEPILPSYVTLSASQANLLRDAILAKQTVVNDMFAGSRISANSPTLDTLNANYADQLALVDRLSGSATGSGTVTGSIPKTTTTSSVYPTTSTRATTSTLPSLTSDRLSTYTGSSGSTTPTTTRTTTSNLPSTTTSRVSTYTGSSGGSSLGGSTGASSLGGSTGGSSFGGSTGGSTGGKTSTTSFF